MVSVFLISFLLHYTHSIKRVYIMSIGWIHFIMIALGCPQITPIVCFFISTLHISNFYVGCNFFYGHTLCRSHFGGFSHFKSSDLLCTLCVWLFPTCVVTQMIYCSFFSFWVKVNEFSGTTPFTFRNVLTDVTKLYFSVTTDTLPIYVIWLMLV